MWKTVDTRERLLNTEYSLDMKEEKTFKFGWRKIVITKNSNAMLNCQNRKGRMKSALMFDYF